MSRSAPAVPVLKMRPLCAALLVLHFAGPARAQAQAGSAAPSAAPAAQTLEAVTVRAAGLGATTERTGSYTTGQTSTATRLDLSPRETPQSVSVVTRTQMDDFGLTDVNDALENTPGIQVEQVETDRTYYSARGFDVTNFQLDGVGLPFMYGNVAGSIDSAIYDRVEVVRGGTALTSGLSDPSATINFIRKRPTANFQASAGLTVDSWNKRRLDADLSGALNDAGSVRARVVAAHENRDSYLDRYELKKSVLYGVIEADIGPSTMLSFGHNTQRNDADSPLWGALPLYNTDGTPLRYARSTSSAADWAYWDNDKSSTFAELEHTFANGWLGKAVVTRNKISENSRLFYVYGVPNPTTAGSDLFSYPSLYELQSSQTIVDAYASGPFSLFGREHELMVGAHWAKASLTDLSTYGEDIGTEIPPLEGWDGSYPLPGFTGGTDGSDIGDRQTSLYAATRLSLTDRLQIITGTRATRLTSRGVTYNTSRVKDYGTVLTPYAGATYRINDTYSVYGSYSKLFRPQFEVNASGERLEAVRGRNVEAGVKGEFMDKKLNASFAVFRVKQNNLAQPAGFVPFAFHTASDEISSQGYELDLSGEVLPGLQLTGGYTHIKIEDSNGNPTRTYVPRNLLRLSASYKVQSVPGMKVGASLNWQDAITLNHPATATTGPNAGSPIVTRYDSYAVLNLMTRYEFNKNLSATLNLNNVTDERYTQSLYWAQAFGQGYPGAPRNVSLALNWKY